MRSGAIRALVALGLLAALLPSSALANRIRVERLTPLSGATPFPRGCGVPGQQTRSSEAEPSVARDPRNPRRLVATWQQDRFPVDGGALSNVVASSGDRGRTWRRARLPGLSRCTGGRDERSSDPWASIGADGRVYLASLTFSETPAALVGAAGPTAQWISVSTNGGASFSRPASIADQRLYDDREAVTADPARRGHAYVAWVRRYGGFGESGIEMFSRTRDGGRSWSSPAAIYTPPSGTLTDPTLIKVLPDGSLLNVFILANGTPVLKQQEPETPLVPWDVMASRSTDQGQNWSLPVAIGRIEKPDSAKDPDSGADVRAFPVISTDVARDGTAYVAWNDISSPSSSRILFSRSRNGGRSWTGPSPVASLRTQGFVPSLAVADNGTVGVTWYDFRGDRRGDHKLTTNVWLAHSHDRGAHWQQSHVAGPFDMLTAPPTSSTDVAGRFVGDYEGLAGLRSGFAAVFAQARPQARSGPSDVFFARLGTASRKSKGKRRRIHLRIRPRRVRAGKRVRFRFRAWVIRKGHGPRKRRHRLLRRARIRFGHKRVRTNRRGFARIRVRFRKPGRKRARVSKPGYRSGKARVRVIRRRRR